MQNRTDLAVESYESADKTEIDGVRITEKGDVTAVEVLDENGAAQIGKPVGTYITLRVPSFVSDTDIFDGRLVRLADILKSLLPADVSSVLVAGVGNSRITADALGPAASGYVLATRHIIGSHDTGLPDGLFDVSSISTGVLGDTGIESAEIIKGVAGQISPSCVIVIDALAASSASRLGTTVQLSDTGISPGSGVGNHRYEISRETLGVPVVSIGIPTVLSVEGGDGGSMFVTPREIDRITEHGAKLIGMAVNTCFQKSLGARDIFSLVS
jgi:spore protease